LAALVANSVPPLSPVPGKTWCLNKGHAHLCTIFRITHSRFSQNSVKRWHVGQWILMVIRITLRYG